MLTRSYYKKRQKRFESRKDKGLFVAWMARGNDTGIYIPTDIQELIASFLINRLEQKNLPLENFRAQIISILRNNRIMDKTDDRIMESEKLFTLLAENLATIHLPACQTLLQSTEKKLLEFGKLDSWGHRRSKYYWELIYEDDYPGLDQIHVSM